MKTREEIEEQKRIYFQNPDGIWESLKSKLHTMEFPTEEKLARLYNDKNLKKGESHVHKEDGKKHNLSTFTWEEDLKDFRIQLIWEYNVCEDCKKIVKRTATLLNSYENSAHTRYFTRNGEPVVKDYVDNFNKTTMF